MDYMNRPLVERMIEFTQKKPISFHVPGHKNGMLSGLPVELRSALSFDMTELTGLDDLHQPEEVIKEAQERLADFYQSDSSYFLVNGSTVGNLAMIYATCRAGDLVIVQRNAHKSIFNALELVEAKPILITPEWDEYTTSVGVVSEKQVQEAIRLYPGAKAVILTYPTYYGTTGNQLEEIIKICHSNRIPVLVDEAHGAHFGIGKPFPKSALTLGADIVVHSAHKTLPAMTMGSYLHVKSTLVSEERVEKYLQMLQSSSPSYLLMASLDDARAYAETYTEKDVSSFLQMRKELIDQMVKIKDLEVITANDPLKLMIRVEEYTGFQLLEALENEQIYAELADPYQVLFVLPLLKEGMDYPIKEISHRIQKAIDALDRSKKVMKKNYPTKLTRDIAELCYNREELEEFQSDWLHYEEAIGKVVSASVIPYPPGIPLLLAGERVSKEDIELLVSLTNMNASFQGAIRIKEKKIFVVINEVGE